MPLVGFLWKRGSSWRSFTYKRRFFYLTENALCYSTRPPSVDDMPSVPALSSSVSAPAVAPQAKRSSSSLSARSSARSASVGSNDLSPGERRIPLSSVKCVRMHSKLKYEFELVCTTRSYRLRAPSAQALALWVTAISSEWLQLRNAPAVQASQVTQASQPPERPTPPRIRSYATTRFAEMATAPASATVM